MPLGNRCAAQLLLLGVLAPGVLPAQEPYLVRDISQGTQPERGLASDQVLAATLGLFYSFDDGLHGAELDFQRNSSNDDQLFDLCPGPCGSSPRDFAELDGKVYFFADDGLSGLELWRTDGTPAGTILVRDVCPGPCPGWPDDGSSLVRAGDALFFRARDTNGQVRLWTSDGTHGLEVWSSDGVATAMLRDDCPGACSSGPAQDLSSLFTPYDHDVLYWQLVPGSPGRWRLRSTANVPEDPPIELQGLPSVVVLGNALLLTTGSVLARIDIPTFTLSVVRDFGHFMDVGPVVALGDIVLFEGQDLDHGSELWRSDGTEAGTQLVADTVLGPGSGTFRKLVTAAGKLFFIDWRSALWVSDGTAGGTHRFDNALWSPFYATGSIPDPINKRLLVTTPSELWATNGSGPYPVRSQNTIPGSTDLRSLTPFAGTLFFGARKHEERPEPYRLWRSDGTEGGTEILSPLAGAPEDAAPFQGGLVFRSGTGICKTDGTAGGTRRVLNRFEADHLKVAGDRLFFSGIAYDGPDAWCSMGAP